MTVIDRAVETPVSEPRGRTRGAQAGLLALAIAVPGLLALPLTVLWPEPADGNWWTYGDVAPIRDRFWAVLSVLSVALIIGTLAQAVAVLRLTGRRGGAWVTSGAALLWVGAAAQAVGVGGWAATYFFATDPSLGQPAATPFLHHISDDPHLLALAMPGELLVAVGTIAQAIGLLRARRLPVWVPILSLGLVASFFLPTSGVLGLLCALPATAASFAIAGYVWQRR